MSQWSSTVARNYGRLGEQSHVAILAEHLAPLMQPRSLNPGGASMLDFGCGEGHLGVRLASMCDVGRVVCVDQSPELLELARRHAEEAALSERFSFHRGDEMTLDDIRRGERFDFILCSLMLMMCENRLRLDRSIAALIEACRPAGRVLIVLTHPCFRRAVHATYHNELPDDFEYWHSGRPYRVVLDPDVRQVATTFDDYHWTLADYASAIHDGDGAIAQMLELPGQYDVSGRPIGDPAYLVLCVQPPAT